MSKQEKDTKMTQNELDEILQKHKIWLNSGGEKGERANLNDADLTHADLHCADLRNADLSGANLNGADLRGANFRNANLTRANLRNANLRNADLTHADLRGANLDFSCLPLWCGSLEVKVDKRIACQIAYHFCSLVCDDEDFIAARNSILDFANQFHRVEKCGKLERVKE